MSDLVKLSDEELDKLIESQSRNKSAQDLSDEELDLMIAEKSKAQGPTELEAAWTGVKQGGTLGTAPVLAGAGEAFGRGLGLLTAPNLDMSFKEKLKAAGSEALKGFKEGRKETIEEQKRAWKEQPVATGVGSVVGGLVTGGGLVGAPGKVGQAAKAILGAPTTMTKAVGQGLAAGAGTAIGEAESLGEAGEKLAGGAFAGLLGYGAAKGLEAAPKVLSPKLDKLADKFAFMSLRGYKKDIKQAFKKNEIEDVGRELYKQGIVDKMPKSVESLAQKTGEKLKVVGKAYGDLLEDISKKVGPVIDKGEVVQSVLDKMDDTSKSMLLSQMSSKKKVDRELLNFIKNPEPITISEAQQIKQSLNSASKWNTNFIGEIPDQVQLARSLYHEMNNSIDNTAAALASRAGTAKEIVQGLRNQYHNLKVANTIAEGRSLGEVSNRFISPSDYISGAAGLIAAKGGIEGGLTGAAMAAANKVAREYGASALGIAAKKGAKGLEKLGKVSPKVPTQLLQTTQRGLLSKE